jgi:hypothetical protein
MLGRHEIGVGAGGALARQLEHLRAQRGDAAGPLRHAGRVEPVHVVAHHLERLAPVPADQRRVADAEAEHHPRLAIGRLALPPGGDVFGLLFPDVDDAGADGDALGRRKQPIDVAEHGIVDAAGNPQRTIAQLLEFRRGFDAHRRIAEAQFQRPDAHRTQIHLAHPLLPCRFVSRWRGSR